ncbi:MAG: hypothetical protein K9K82_13350 [Desulfobacteraceae bacterium]|nr:hypothetical protein [Desulfobacteraceae bacterium]
MTSRVFFNRTKFILKRALIFGFLALLIPGVCAAELSEMTNAEMAQIRGTGPTNLYIEGDTVRLFLDIHMETFGEIDSAKAAYYPKEDSSGTTVYNWDVNWTDVTIGQSMATPLVTDGLIFRTEFDDINASNKQLKRIIIGTNNMDGQISGTFTTTTGAVNPTVVGQTTTAPIVMNRSGDLQGKTLNMDNTGFFIDINFNGTSPERGVKTIIGYPESKAVNFTFSSNDWWQ